MKLVMTLVLGVLGAALIGAGFWLWTPDRPRAALEAKYFDAQSRYVDVDGIRLHVRDSGPKDAPAIVMLHGFGSSLHTWEPWASVLAAEHRVVRFDLPGSGLTGADPRNDYTDDRATRLVAALMDKLDVQRASVIGNSIGGRIAWRFAAQHPERVDKLVLIAPDGFASPGFEYGKAPTIPAMFRMLPWVLPKAMLRMNLAPAYGDPANLGDDVLSRYYDLMLTPGVRAAVIARTEQTVLAPPAPWLEKIRAPTLLVWGERDAMIPVANAQDYLRLIPGSKLVAFPALGHVPFEEAPATSLPPVRAFLAS
jgi:pimeloyl-ACP methyl ester carboxylesterase